MISDISDLKTWAKAVCSGKLLKAETHRERLRTQPIDGWSPYMEYGEGIMKMGAFCGHGGDLFGFNSAMWYLPQRDATIVINVNRTNPGGEPLADTLAWDIAEILFPKYVGNRR